MTPGTHPVTLGYTQWHFVKCSGPRFHPVIFSYTQWASAAYNDLWWHTYKPSVSPCDKRLHTLNPNYTPWRTFTHNDPRLLSVTLGYTKWRSVTHNDPRLHPVTLGYTHCRSADHYTCNPRIHNLSLVSYLLDSFIWAFWNLNRLRGDFVIHL